MLCLDFVKVFFDLSVCWLSIFSDDGVFHGLTELCDTLALRKLKASLTHAIGSFRILRIVVKDTLALIDNLIVVLDVQLAESKIASATHLGLLAFFGVCEVLIQSDCVYSLEVLLAGLVILLLFKKCVCSLFNRLSFVVVSLLVSG